MALEATIKHVDGRYPFAAGAAYSPGDVVIRPSGTLAIFDGFEDCASGDLIDPQPIHPFPTAIFPANSGDTWSAGDVLYWDDTNKVVTTTSTGNKRVGVSIAAKTSGQTSAHVECTPV